jgi:hypothetical protein
LVRTVSNYSGLAGPGKKTAAEILARFGLPPPPPRRDRYYTTCPNCSRLRSTAAHRKAEVLGVTIDSDGVRFGCNHCGWTGGGKFFEPCKPNGHDNQSRSFEAIYDYTDEDGNVLFQVCRTHDKQFPQRQPNGKWGVNGVRKVLYRLPEIIEAAANERPILILEGEKDVNSAWEIGLPATCNPGGAGKWLAEYSEVLRGADIVLIPDNDAPGRAHTAAVACMSAGIVRSIRIIDLTATWSKCPRGGDLSDWLAAGGTREQLDALIEHAPYQEPETPEPPDQDARGPDAPPRQKERAKGRSAILVRGDQVPLRSVQWAWKHRFAFGKIALIAGDPGLGKSQAALDILARMTVGDSWPVDGGKAPIAEAMVLTAEDGLSDTVAPRLVAAGADMSKVHFLTGTKVEGGEEELFDLTRDVQALRDALKKNPAIKVIIIDPLTAYLGETQAQRNAQVRKALAPLVRLIEETEVLVIGVTHLNKSAGKAIYRVLESIAFVAVGRILHLVIADSENPINRKFICDKTNIGPKPPGLTFICQQVPVTTEDGEEWVSRICWGTAHITETADQALEAQANSGEKAGARDGAEKFLRRLLADGPVPFDEVLEAAKASCISERILRRVKDDLGVISDKDGFKGGWAWSLPAEDGQRDTEDVQ